jgi:hypothetical protein
MKEKNLKQTKLKIKDLFFPNQETEIPSNERGGNKINQNQPYLLIYNLASLSGPNSARAREPN